MLIRLAVGLCAAVLLLLVVDRRLNAFLYPWDDASAGPTLSGTWVGRLTTGSGRPRGVLMELHRWKSKRVRGCATCASIEGSARVCDERGADVSYTVGGKPGDRRANTVTIGAVPVPPPPTGLEFSSVRGRWDRAETLSLEAQFHWRNGVHAMTDSDDPDNAYVPLPMKRGSVADYRATCRALIAP
jgi:hypothetical protein